MLKQVVRSSVGCEALHAPTSNGQIHVTGIDRESSSADNEGIRCPEIRLKVVSRKKHHACRKHRLSTSAGQMIVKSPRSRSRSIVRRGVSTTMNGEGERAMRKSSKHAKFATESVKDPRSCQALDDEGGRSNPKDRNRRHQGQTCQAQRVTHVYQH
jgi:hypothetical protein